MAGRDKPDEDPSAQTGGAGFNAADVEVIEHGSRLRAPMIYEILRREGDEEMERPLTSLWWSGVAAGLSLSLSLLSQAILQTHIPDSPWRPLVTALGYTVGFLVAVMARHQLFTENTITAVLPVAAQPSLKNFAKTGRLWAVVLAANFVGTFLAALFYVFTQAVPPEVKAAMVEIAAHSMAAPPLVQLIKAVAAGFIIATMVWLLPSAQTAQLHVVILMTWLIAAGEFAHIVAGSLEAFMLVLEGRMAVGDMLTGFVAPVLTGNIIGGTVLFSLLSYGQVAKEMGGGKTAED